MSERKQIFVFGSTTNGSHKKGLAKYAADNYGAVDGVASGPSGNSYAIPVRTSTNRMRRSWYIANDIRRFLNYAKAHPELDFIVSHVGFEVGELDVREIAYLFSNPPANCTLPAEILNSVP